MAFAKCILMYPGLVLCPVDRAAGLQAPLSGIGALSEQSAAYLLAGRHWPSLELCCFK